ncbi:ABC transporter ATP-binding protein [Chamaesiphon sp. VAR_48_metabat_135_sub]|uniref:ABC transporter ATP-binding protein n=1 Tax=Chamaesiphon sp. VAR_48_metabat_135_sub TaxID=2964699 RepID=UPI00286AE601|nr:ABC transporter ATP-binding protein [Chamaesiphon sp. VAR_48_metabat_135_sub]
MKQRSNYWQIIPYLRPHWQIISVGLLCVIIFSLFSPLMASLAGDISKHLGDGNLQLLIKFALIGGLVYILRGIAQYGQDALMAKVAFTVTLDLRKRVYAHLLQVGSAYTQTVQTGDLAYRLTEDVDRVAEVIYKIFHQFIPCVLQLILILGYLVWVNWQLTITVFILVPIIAIIVGWFGEKLQKFSLRSQNRTSDLASLITEFTGNMRSIQAFAAEDYANFRFGQEAELNYQAKYGTEHLKAFQFPIISFIQAASILFLFVLAGWQISLGNLTSSVFVSYLIAIALLIDPIAITTGNFNDIKQAEASVDRVFELFTIPVTITEKANAIELPRITGKIDYHHVSFGYTPDKPILKSFDLNIKPGETIALVGASGAGKSTILSLLNRFHDVSSGSISIDDIDIRDVTLKSLRRQIGIVPQDTVLLSGHIAQNIAFGQTDFDIQAVEAAAKIANAHQFISQLSQGYYTYVGEKGTTLSGGQKQRIAIARAVLFNPRILILDEATSALDSESEALVQEALERIMADRTVFIIAHRLATVRKADRILVIENGEIIEAGTHPELLEKTGRYAQFYARQFNE